MKRSKASAPQVNGSPALIPCRFLSAVSSVRLRIEPAKPPLMVLSDRERRATRVSRGITYWRLMARAVAAERASWCG